MRCSVESLPECYPQSPVVDLVVKGDKKVEDDDHLKCKNIIVRMNLIVFVLRFT